MKQTILASLHAAYLRFPGGGVLPETYAEVEAARFTSGGRVTLIVQNAGPARHSCDPTALNGGALPSRIGMPSVPNLTDTKLARATVVEVPPSPVVTLPPYSVTRMIWEGRAPVVRRHLERAPAAP